MKPLLEICCDHLESALAAYAGGADRIELCSALSTDGLTPSTGLLASVKKQLSIPIFVLIRPRPGSFIYNDAEIDSMLMDIHHSKGLGADGIVSGALDMDNKIDKKATAKLIAAARPLPFTFHKAFDLTPDPMQALDDLLELGAKRVLTLGQAASAVEGKTQLGSLVNRSRGKIKILCAGGVRDHNLSSLLDIQGLNEFHSAALDKNSNQKETHTASLWKVNKQMVERMAAILVK